ncbi:hypothetical protein GBAR_LOCUS18584 [Geodia barretti]|uniref:Cupin type-2 domain-containing protein n=1 Tax=Geodia barretti TaxID=519541 RepID=A0AA35SN72_GEOBA|nr:hypothetical protein GBAR_LOCUS18584 [Geodia barretti]
MPLSSTEDRLGRPSRSRVEKKQRRKSANFNFSLVNFYAGAKNKFHSHTSDQILFVTKGEGIVASEAEEVGISTGDTAFIPAGEKHWHGAADGQDFTHISLTGADSETTQYDD